MERAPQPTAPVSVSELTFALKGHIERRFSDVRVQGEVFSARAVSSGHLYFTLKDANAQLPCVVWRSTLARLPMRLRDGMQVEATGDVQVYPPHGRYQLVIRRLADVGIGQLLARLEALKQAFHQAGYFDPARKRPLPLLPRRVAVVTAATGAAVRDIVRAALGRFPADIVVFPVRVQGAGAAADIARAIRAVAFVPGVDVIIVGRGGGSLEDLWAFNEAPVIEAIVASPLPVVSAVGHEIDTTLSDLAADHRAATPTAAGALVVPPIHDLRYTIGQHVHRLAHQVRRRANDARHRLAAPVARLRDPARLVAERQQRLDDRAVRLHGALARRLEIARARLRDAETRLRAVHPTTTLRAARARTEALSERARRAGLAYLSQQRRALDAQRRALTILSPAASLERGYAIVRAPDGRVIRDAAQVGDGAAIDLVLHRGALRATVIERHARNAYEPPETE